MHTFHTQFAARAVAGKSCRTRIRNQAKPPGIRDEYSTKSASPSSTVFPDSPFHALKTPPRGVSHTQQYTQSFTGHKSP